ncbi:MAG: xanthine dehydrogenase family protein subunit M [Candidatus Planktophila sp.]|jgi:aerobic carbon-monoxide dehydrogenase medium subunit|tara:strand:+ start:7853 stop:8722 length:870 start_codon:yes stop_codon:yes gene_type:complete
MYPSRFDYESPKTVEEAVKLLEAGKGEAKVLAGGQSLVPMLKLRFAFPEQVVDINNIPGLDYIRFDADGSLHIGALVRHEHLEKSAEIAKRQPTISAAAPLVADPIVRTRGTFVGSVCHADPQGDWAATMIALNGSIIVQGPKGKRTIAMKDFVLGPYATSMNYNELAIEAVIPAPKGVARGGYLKLERRVGDFATASVAVALDMDGDTVIGAGFALAGVGGKTIDANEAASALIGQKLTEATIAKAAAIVAAKAEPRTDHRGSAEYKRHIVEIFVKRILVANSTQKVA